MPSITAIDVENATFQRFETLRRNRSKRRRQRAFLVEGVRQINGALEHGWHIEAFLFAHDREPSRWALNILSTSQAEAHFSLPLRLLAKLSAKNDTSELVAVVGMPDDDLGRITLGRVPLLVVLDRPGSPGNLGTIIRSSALLGVDGLVVTGHAADPYDPEAVAASTGSLFALPVVRLPSAGPLWSLIEAMRAIDDEVQVVATSATGRHDLTAVDFRRGTVLLVGNEATGLSHAYLQAADAVAAIPTVSAAGSLNVASATSIVLYEIQRQRSS